jgi:hypothetical protein
VKSNGRVRRRAFGLRAGLPAAAVAVMGLVACSQLSEGPPTDIALSAATDTTVRVSWTPPAGAVPDSYVLAFSETGTSDWVGFGAVPDTVTRADHNPLGRTGRYRVSAVFRDREYPATEAPTSAPVHADVMAVGELNSPSYSAYGWERDSGGGSVFTMRYASNADRVDFYVTDWASGFGGPDYAMASPDWGPYEPGGAGFVPVGAWRATWFSSPPAGEQAPLPPLRSGGYANQMPLSADSTLVAVCTDMTTGTLLGPDRYYALVRLGHPDVASGTVQIETWFQRIRGLRLIQH